MSLIANAAPSTNRFLEMLSGSDSVVADAVTSTSQLAGLGLVTSGIDALPGEISNPDPQASNPADISTVAPVVDAANDSVLQFHAELEGVGHEVQVLNEPLHALTNFGEAIGPGYIGDTRPDGHSTLATDFLTLPGALVAGQGDTAAAETLSDTGGVLNAAERLALSPTGALDEGGGAVGSGGLLQPLVDGANGTVLGVHADLEGTGHSVPVLNGPVHGLTTLGETLGLGHLGEVNPDGSLNLLTDVATAPGHILAGGSPLAAAATLLTDTAHTVSAADGLLGSLTDAADPAHGSLLASSGLLAPVSGVANAAILGLQAELEDVGHSSPVLNGPIHELTNVGETVGLGHLGEAGAGGSSNLLTEAVNIPGSVLAGEGIGAITPVLNDVGPVAGAASGLLGSALDATGALGGGTVSGAGSGLVADVLHVPSSMVAGDGTNALTPVLTDIGHVAGATDGAPSGLLGSAGAGGGLVGTAGGAVTATAGTLTGDGGSGSQPLVTAGIGAPDTILGADALSPHGGGNQAAEANVGTAPHGQPPLADASLLSGTALTFPSLGGAGVDSLVGTLADTAPVHTVLAEASPQHTVDLAPVAAIAFDASHLPTADSHHQTGLLHGLI